MIWKSALILDTEEKCIKSCTVSRLCPTDGAKSLLGIANWFLHANPVLLVEAYVTLYAVASIEVIDATAGDEFAWTKALVLSKSAASQGLIPNTNAILSTSNTCC